MASDKKYRWDIQGLRAFAVLAVVIFHINPHKLPGGYLGVDIFFVISGFLIIGFIWNDLEQEKFSLLTFYSKRVKRLFPAFFATAIISSIFVYKLFLPSELKTYCLSLISSLAYSSNFFFYTQSDYFAPSMHFAPLLHTWSLSVEEQFYLIFPVFILLIHKTKSKRILLYLSTIAVLSFILSEYWVQTNESLAFFATPSRFWQFIAGGLIALAPLPKKPPQWFIESLSLCSLAYLCYSLFAFNKHTPFPGIEAVLPTVASCALLFCGLYKNKTSSFLSNPIATFFGKISYSFYLWHWPIIVFFKLSFQWEARKELDSSEQIFTFLLSIAVAYLSWRFIENTVIKVRTKEKSWKPIALTLSTSLLICCIAFFSLDGLPKRFSPKQIQLASFLDYKKTNSDPSSPNQCFLTQKRNDLSYYNKEKCIAHEKTKTNYLLIGDSHADHWVRGFKKNLNDSISLSIVTSSNCTPSINKKKKGYCNQLMNWALTDLIKEKRFQKIIFSARWTDANAKPFLKILDSIQNQVDSIVIFGPIIEYSSSLPRLLALEDDFKNSRNYSQKKKVELLMMNSKIPKNSKYISIIDLVCQDENSCRTLSNNKAPLQYDYGHLTDEAATDLLEEINVKNLLAI